MGRGTALITGASSGIGLELARVFAGDGWDLALTARREERLAELAGELERAHGATVRVLPADLARPGAAAELFEQLRRDGVAIEAVVNNAGFGLNGLLLGQDPEVHAAMIQVNVAALTRLTRLCLPPMLERASGYVLNVASTAAFQPGPRMAVYYATKAYVLSFTEAIAEEVHGSGVRVSCLCPGPTTTGFAAVAGMEDSNLFKLGAMDAATVARAGYRGMLKGRAVVIPGLLNRLAAFSIRFSPRLLVRKAVKRLQS